MGCSSSNHYRFQVGGWVRLHLLPGKWVLFPTVLHLYNIYTWLVLYYDLQTACFFCVALHRFKMFTWCSFIEYIALLYRIIITSYLPWSLFQMPWEKKKKPVVIILKFTEHFLLVVSYSGLNHFWNPFKSSCILSWSLHKAISLNYY